MAQFLQYVNLYKTVWWLPNSYTYALNFYLIDPYLCAFLAIINSRRVLYVFVNEFYVGRSSWLVPSYVVQSVKLVTVLAVLQLAAVCVYHIFQRYSLGCCACLFVPLVSYLLMYNFQLGPFFGQFSPEPVPSSKPRPHDPVYKTLPIHSCDMVPENCRGEVEFLKSDFNARFKQCLFNSFTCAYYVAIAPLCFTDVSLYYDAFWCWQHATIIFLTAFVMFSVYLIPTRYLFTLHCCAVHLGKWMRVEGRNMHIPYIAWSELQVWAKGATVKHVRGLFKAEGFNNCAEPGNSMHSRFYFMFCVPGRFTCLLLFLNSALIIYQYLILVSSTEWHRVISMAIILFCNYYMLFKLVRDSLILRKAKLTAAATRHKVDN